VLHGLPTQTPLTPPRDGRLPGDLEVSKEPRASDGPALPHGRRALAHIQDDRIVTAWVRAGVGRIATSGQGGVLLAPLSGDRTVRNGSAHWASSDARAPRVCRAPGSTGRGPTPAPTILVAPRLRRRVAWPTPWRSSHVPRHRAVRREPRMVPRRSPAMALMATVAEGTVHIECCRTVVIHSCRTIVISRVSGLCGGVELSEQGVLG
jgi:hypothetical protein